MQSLTILTHFSQRPESAFHGIGGDSSPNAARLGERRFDLGLRYRRALSSDLLVTATVGHEWWQFDPTAGDDEDSIARAILNGRFAAPPALEDGVMALSAGGRIDFDSRRGRLFRKPRLASDYEHVSGSGLTFGTHVLQHVGLRATRADPTYAERLPVWISYGATTSGTLDLTATQRRLELELYAFFVDPMPGAGDVPFSHLASLGGSRPMRGFGQRRLIDRSAAVATLRYLWPVWTLLDGTLHASLGNVFGAHLEGFELARLRASFGIGLASATASDHPFELLIAFGTESLENGARIENTRLTAGTMAHF